MLLVNGLVENKVWMGVMIVFGGEGGMLVLVECIFGYFDEFEC